LAVGPSGFEKAASSGGFRVGSHLTQCFRGCDDRTTRPARDNVIPFNWQQMTSTPRFGRAALAMAARQAYCSQLPDVSLFRYFILADRNSSGDDEAGTHLTNVSGQMNILFSHLYPRIQEYLPLGLGPSPALRPCQYARTVATRGRIFQSIKRFRTFFRTPNKIAAIAG